MGWKIIGASSIGSSHITSGIPCQDSFSFSLINENCGIAILADGAGSYKNSHIGSQFVTEKGLELFTHLILKNKWHEDLPSLDLWRVQSIKVAQRLLLELAQLAENLKYDIKELSSTLTVAFFSTLGICILNIGDGRGAIKDADNNWLSILTPYHGEEVGMTVFLTSDLTWKSPNKFIETKIIKDNVNAFIIISDGLEKFLFECYKPDSSGKYHDPNLPFTPTLDFIYQTNNLFLSKHSAKLATKKWESFLKNGHEILSKEADDKTMIFGLFTRTVENLN